MRHFELFLTTVQTSYLNYYVISKYNFDESLLFCLACSILVFLKQMSLQDRFISSPLFLMFQSANYTRMQYVIKYDSFTQKTASFSISSSSSYCTFSLFLQTFFVAKSNTIFPHTHFVGT